MSRWHFPQVSLVRKKPAGMIPRTFVSAEEGKNGPFGPIPSWSMLSATTTGFSIRYAWRRSASRPDHAMAAAAAAKKAAARETRMAAATRLDGLGDDFRPR